LDVFFVSWGVPSDVAFWMVVESEVEMFEAFLEFGHDVE
jgi:hypothetical protein